MLNENDDLGRDNARLEHETGAAMRDLAGTVTSAPPLRLTAERAPGTGARRRRRGGVRQRGGPRRRGWAAPLLAAAAVAAVAVALVLARGTTGEAPAPPSLASPAPTASLDGTPAYYVAWMPAGKPYLVVGSTRTGRRVATVMAPDGVQFSGIYGAAADDRTFIVTGDQARGPGAGTVWYLLRIAPGSSVPARLTPLPVPVRQDPAGVALSPNGAKIAVALPGRPATLRVYAVAGGALLRQWSTKAAGELQAGPPNAGGLPFPSTELRWSADGRQLGFAWNATAIRVLDATGPDGDLISRSQQAAVIGTAYAAVRGYTCHATQGWQLITIPTGATVIANPTGSTAGQGVICGGSMQYDPSAGCRARAAATCSFSQEDIGFMSAVSQSHGHGHYWDLDAGTGCASQSGSPDGAYVGWASADGSVIIGAEVCGGQSRFGVFRGGKFTSLPLTPVLPKPPSRQAPALAAYAVW